MHKKSMEAAETLKNSEDNSDREESRTDASDISAGSSLNNHGPSPIKSPGINPPGSTNCGSTNGANSSSNNLNCGSGSHNAHLGPSSGGVISHLSPTSAHSPINSSSTASITPPPPPPNRHRTSPLVAPPGSLGTHPNHHHPHLPPAHPAHNHSPVDTKEFKLNNSSSPTGNSYHPENDPEAFRWVDYRDPVSYIRNNSIACLRAKAQEHQARLLNSGLLLQVRSLAGLQNPLHHAPPSGAGNGAGTGVGLPSPHHSDTNGNNLLLASYHHSPTQEIDRQRSEANSSNGSAISITG